MLNITDPRYNLLSVNHFLTRSKFRIACGLGSAGSRGRYNYNFLAEARLRASSDIAKGPPMDQIYSVLAPWEYFFSTLKWIFLLHWNFNISVDCGLHWLTASFPFDVFSRCAHSCWRRGWTTLPSLAPFALFSLDLQVIFFPLHFRAMYASVLASYRRREYIWSRQRDQFIPLLSHSAYSGFLSQRVFISSPAWCDIFRNFARRITQDVTSHWEKIRRYSYSSIFSILSFKRSCKLEQGNND